MLVDYGKAMADDAVRFTQSVADIDAAELRDQRGGVQVYAGRLVDGPEAVRLVTPIPGERGSAVADRLDTWASLGSHPDISTVHARGTDPRPWLAVTTTGTPLPEVAPLSADEARSVLGDVAEGLREAVGAGVTPDPIAPTAVRVTADGATLDWPTGPAADSTLRPERADEHAAVFELGRLAHYAVTGQPLPPEIADRTADAQQDGRESVPPLDADTPPAFDTVVTTALTPDGYDSPYEFKRALLFESQPTPRPTGESRERAADTAPPVAEPPSNDISAESSPSDGNTAIPRRALLGATGVAAATIAGGAWAATTYLQGPETERFPQFRFDAANTGYAAETTGPTDGVTEGWSFDLGDDARASPVVANGTVLVNDGDGSVYGLAAEDGTERWRESLNAFGAVTAALSDGNVYFGDNRPDQSAAITAHSLSDGSERWRSDTIETLVRTPTVADGRLFVFGNRGVYGFDTAGKLQWESEQHSATSLTGAVADGTLYVGALSRASSESTWEERTRGVAALDVADGSTRWVFDGGSTVGSSPAVADGTIYVGLEENGLVALDKQSGEVTWRFSVTEPILSSPAVTDHGGGTVYVGCNDGSVYAVDTERGVSRWEFETGDAVISSPAVASDTVYVGSTDNTVYALDALEGTVRWQFDTDGRIISSPAVVSNKLFVGSNDGTLHALTEP